MQVVWIRVQIGILMYDGEVIDAQRCRGALRRASPSILDDSSRSIAFGELPNIVAGQATRLLARGQRPLHYQVGGVCWACASMCQRVPSRETNSRAFL